jgi:hypothetical protein
MATSDIDLNEALRHHLGTAAPWITVHAGHRPPAKRIPGHLTPDRESRGYDHVFILVEEGSARCRDRIEVAVEALMRFDSDNQRGDFPLSCSVFGKAGTRPGFDRLIGYTSQSSLIEDLCQQATEIGGDTPGIIDAIGTVTLKSLVLILCMAPGAEVRSVAADRLKGVPEKSVVWVFVKDGRFGVGRTCP